MGYIPAPFPKKLLDSCVRFHMSKEEVSFHSRNSLELRDNGQATEENDNSDDASDSSSFVGDDSLSEIAEDLLTKANYLMDLDPLYEAASDQLTSYDAEPVANFPELYSSQPVNLFTERIKMKFPNVNMELANYLGQANYNRCLRGYEQRNSAQSVSVQDVENTEGTVVESRFYDSGIGTSAGTGTPGSQYAETVMSFHHENGVTAKIPPLPDVGKNKRPFICLACGKLVVIRSNKQWK